MGVISVFKKIGSGFKEAGKGIAKGADVTVDALGHPVAQPVMAALSFVVPISWLTYGVNLVRQIKATADAAGDVPMSDEQKREMFAREFKKEYPDASSGDLATLASVLTKLEKSGETEGG